jgi:hypothetical protein
MKMPRFVRSIELPYTFRMLSACRPVWTSKPVDFDGLNV